MTDGPFFLDFTFEAATQQSVDVPKPTSPEGLVFSLQRGNSNGDLAGSLGISGACPSQSFGLGLVVPIWNTLPLHPSLDQSCAALIQVWIWIAATIILVIGVALVHRGDENGDPIAAVGSFVVLGDMLLFGWLLHKSEQEAAHLKFALHLRRSKL